MKMIGLSTNSRQLSYVRYICFENQYTLDNFCVISHILKGDSHFLFTVASFSGYGENTKQPKTNQLPMESSQRSIDLHPKV